MSGKSKKPASKSAGKTKTAKKSTKKQTVKKTKTAEKPQKQQKCNGLQRDIVKDLINIGISLSNEVDLEKLLNKIVYEARRFTHSDAGSVFLIEDENLRFFVMQNDTLKRNYGLSKLQQIFGSTLLPISEKSIAGYVALTAKELNIPEFSSA